MRANVETITPSKAKQMLLGSESYQRNISIAAITHLAKQMKDGKWVLNGETIVVSEKGQVLDGQHRLLAVIQANVAVQMMVVYGASMESFHTFDTGKSRTPGNTLHIAGVTNAVNVAGCLTFRWKYHKAKSRTGSLNMWERPTHKELVEYAIENEQACKDAISASAKVRKMVKGINPSTLGGSYLVFAEAHGKEKPSIFFNLLATGEGLEKTSPILALRNKIIQHGDGPSDLKWQVKAAYLFMAYKKFYEDKPTALLRWTEGKDAFPFI